MASPAYLNFDLLFMRTGDSYRVDLVDAPMGEGHVTFDLPFSVQNLSLAQAVNQTRSMTPIGTQPQPGQPSDLEQLGRTLFEAVFQEQMQRDLARSLDEAERAGMGLRIRLRFGEEVAELAALPWEILFDSQESYLGLTGNSVMVRYLRLPKAKPTLLVQPPLRVLALLSSPAGVPPLDLEGEWQTIQSALAELTATGKFVVERLAHPTLTALHERLLAEEFHILHFVGHGIYDPAIQSGALILEDETGAPQLVQAGELASALRTHRSLRLIYLNACEGALSSEQGIFTGVAQRLVHDGAPAVIAMQAEISDQAAIDLARTFYTALANGHPVDAALTQARVALHAGGNPEWAIPVLFSRSPDNRLFDVRDVLPTPTCPYPGMAPFSGDQAHLFFGREGEIAEALDRLRRFPFLAVIGPSGSGKSSMIYAGLIPALTRGPTFGQGRWSVKIMRPGAQAHTALLESLDLPADGLAAATFHQPTLLFVDQFEEIFTLSNSESQDRFFQGLAGLQGRPNLYILLTVRADFYPEIMASPLWETIRANRLELPPLGDEALRAAILEPAARVGVVVDEILAERLLADAAGEPGALPLVQETLVLLWGQVTRRFLSIQAYRGLVGSAGAQQGRRTGLQVAMARQADAALAALTPREQSLSRRIFLRLIQFGEGRRDTRRQQAAATLRSIEPDQPRFDQVLNHLVAHRLLTVTSEERGDPRVDIAHEALIEGWPALGQWIEERRDVEQLRRRLEARAQEWIHLGRGAGGLLDEIQLREAAAWLSSSDAQDLGTHPDLFALVTASQVAIQERNAAQETTRRYQLVLERRAKRRLQGLVAFLLLALLLMGSWFARQEFLRQQARWAGNLRPIPGSTTRFEAYEVTNGRYHRCVQAGVCAEPVPGFTTYYDPEGRFYAASRDLPITGVSAMQAAHFCTWIGRRLPTVDEWRQAATNDETTPWPWGAEMPDMQRAYVMAAEGELAHHPQTVGLLKQGATPNGVYDLVGNVYEWTAVSVDMEGNRGEIWDLRPGSAPQRLAIAGGSITSDIFFLQGEEADIEMLFSDSDTMLALEDMGTRCVE